MSNIEPLSAAELLEQFKESHSDLNTVGKVLSLSESQFVQTYAKDFGHDARKARRAYWEAERIQERVTLLWGNIKDAVASLSVKDALFNNLPTSIPQTFIDHQRAIPGYTQLFGNLDFLEADHCRSIFGPAAYFVDLMRFIERHIPQQTLPVGHRLGDRHPHLFHMSLDCENTFSLVPYIDLVIEVLEDVLQGITLNQTPPVEQAPYEQIATAQFPPSLPFHLPLEELRLYLEQLKLNLQDIYRLFGVIDPAMVEELLPLTHPDRTVDPTVLATHLQSIHDLLVAVEPELAREGLGLSPSNFDLIKTAIAPADLPDYYGTATLTLAGKGSLEDVDVFTAQVGISREKLNTLLFLDLNPDEVQAGLSRLFFINNTGDQAGHLVIESDVERRRFLVPIRRERINQSDDVIKQIIHALDREEVSSQVITSLMQSLGEANWNLPDEALNTATAVIKKRGSHWLIVDAVSQRTYDVALKGDELAIKDALYLRLNNHETPPWLISTFADAGITLSSETQVLVDAADQQWRVWDSEQGITYVIRLIDNALVVFDEPYDRLANLTPQKLDRLYRFLKLAHHLDWSYGDLDWALRSLQGSHVAEKVLQFDGTNDFVAIANTQDLAPSSFTLEAWVMMAETGTQPILAQGNPDGSRTQFLFWITAPGQLAFFTTALTESDLPNWQDHTKGQLLTRNNQRGLNLTGERSLTPGVFTHVAVTVNEKVAVDGKDYYQLKFYINGVLDSTWSLNNPIPFATAPGEQAVNLGKDLLNEYFAGQMAEVRLWGTVRSAAEIATSRFRRFTRQEADLLAYWPLHETLGLEVPDFAERQDVRGRSLPRHPGILGGPLHQTTPIWTQGDLVLDPLPLPLSPYALHFNGRDTYVAGQVPHLALSTFTLEAWFSVSGDQIQPLITKGDAARSHVAYGLRLTASRQLQFVARTETLAGGAIPENELTHVAVVVTPTQAILYVNGEVANELAADWAAVADAAADLYLGRDFDDRYLQGVLQEVRVWEVARSPEQIQFTRHHQLVGTEPGLVAYWRLDDPAPDLQRVRDRARAQVHLYPGGDPTRYQPKLITTAPLLPDPIERQAPVLTFGPNQYPVRLQNSQPTAAGDYDVQLHNSQQRGLGYYEQFSVQFWFQPQGETADEQILLTQGDRDTGLTFYWADRKLYAYAWCTGFNGQPLVGHYAFESGILEPGQWHHATFTYDETQREGIEYRLYVNGAPVEPMTLSDPVGTFRLDQVGPAFIGGLPAGGFARFQGGEATGTHPFSGQITDLRIWDIALPDAEATNIAGDRLPPRVPPATTEHLIAYLPMTENYGRDVSDHQGPAYAEEPPLLVPDQSPQERTATLDVGPDLIAPKWQPVDNLPIFPDTVLTLNGEDQFCYLPYASELGLVGSSFTLELWVRVTDLTSAPPLVGSDRPDLALSLTEQGQLKAAWEGHELISPALLKPDEWHHLAWRCDRATRTHTLFLDGQPTATLTAAGVEADALLYLGRDDQDGGSAAYFSGAISEFRCWSVSRTDAAIAATWNQRLTVPAENLTAYWVFDADHRLSLRDRTTALALTLELLAEQDINEQWVTVDAPPPLDRQLQGLNINQSDEYVPDYIDLSTYTIRNSGTIELWLQFSRRVEQVLLDASSADGAAPFTLKVQNEILSFQVQDSAGIETTAQLPLNELSTAFDEQSHRVAIAWQFEAASQTTVLRLSVDEFRAVATGIGNGIKPAFRHPFIGLNRTNEIEALRRYRGQITQVRVWEAMRSPLDLQQLSHADLAGNEPGLIHYLPMAEGERTTLNDLASDMPVKFKSLSLPHPDPTWIEADYAIELNGQGDFIDIADYQPGDVGSLELWVKFDLRRRQVLLDASTDERHLIGTNQPKAFVITLIRPSGHPVLRFYLEDNVDRDFYADLDLRNLNVADFEATWHHLVATWHYQPDNNTIAAQLFLDHLPPATARQKISERASGRHSGFRSVYIGKNRGDYGAVANRSFQGQVGHFRAWNRVLPVADISLLQNMPWQGIGTGPIVDLPLTEGTGTTLNAQAPTTMMATLTIQEEPAVSRWVVSDRAVAIDHPETFITCPDYIPGPIGTIELWVKFNRDRDQYLLDASGEADADFFVDVAAGQLRFQINDSTAELDLTAFPPAFDTAWHHVVATWKYDAQDQSLELILDSSATASGRDDLAFPACRSLYIGVLRGESDRLSDYRTLQGEVSQLRIWNQAAINESDFLTNIHRRRYADLTGNEAGLLVYLPMEAGAGHALNNLAPGSAATIMYGRFPDVRWVRNPATLLQWRGGYGVLPTTAELGLTDTYTLAAWIYLPDLAGTHPILGTRGPVVDEIAATWVWGLRDGVLFVRVADQELMAADLPLTANTWHHVVCQYDQATQSLRLGRDGIISTSTLDAIAPYTVDRTLYLGQWQRWQAADSDWVRSHFQGLIADLRVWSAALTAEAFAQSRDRRLRGDEPDLLAYWTLTGEQRHRLPALGKDPHWAYLSRDFQSLDFYEAAQPPLYTPRQAPTLDGYNDYLALNEATLVNQPHTIEFWFADTPDQWQHLAIVDGANGEPQFFLNGELIADPSPDLVAKRYAYRMNTRAIDRPARDSAGQLAVTAGPVTDLRLWRTARTQDQIQANYQRHLTGREEDLWAYWPVAMGPGDRLPDATENHRPATLVGGLENTADKWQADPPPQTGSIQALYFDGRDDHLAIGDVVNLPFKQAFTIEAWVKLPPEPPPELLPILATIPSDGPDAVDAGRLMIGLKAGRPCFSLEATSFLWAEQPLDSGWHHLAWQYEPTSIDTAAGTLRIWVDGLQVAEANYRRPFSGAGTLYIGRGQAVDRAAKTVTPRYFQGGLGEVRIWRSLRTADEIRDHRDRPLVGDTDTLADLAAYWIFDVAVTTVIPSQVITDGSRYDLVLQSDAARSQPTWATATHPIWLNPLSAAALSFDGERQHLATPIPLTMAPPFTLEVWVRVADWNEERPIVRWGLPGSAAGFELTVTTEGKVAWQWGSADDEPTTASSNRLITDEQIAVDTFTHIALVASADEQTDEVQLALLINGENAQSATLTTPLGGQSLPLVVGQGGTPAAPTHFKGWMKELRLWQSDRTAALLDHLYHPLTGQEETLLSYWPLTQIEASEGDRLTPNQVANRPALRLGGLPSSRKPTAGEPTQFWDSRHRVLTLPVMPSPPLELAVSGFTAPNYAHRAQRTIEVWFLCRDLASGQKQVIYGEGDETRGLEIYVQSGSLHLAGWNTPIAESGWSGSTISTDRLQANHWHHVALVLNGKDELRDDAFRALLDGRAIATRPGSQLWGHTPTITVGGLTFTPDPQSTIQPITVEHSLHGQIREVRIWETVRTDAQIQAALWGLPENLPESDRPSLLFHWDTTTLTGNLVAPMVLPNPMEAAISSPDLPLIDLAKLHQLQAEWQQAPLEQLCALWAPLRHVGQRDRQTWFDRIFNPAGVEPYWSYAQRLPWQVHSDDTSQRQIRTRLLSTLRVSQAELQVMVQAISGVNAEQIVLDGAYLTSLYRLKLLASLLRLAIADLVGLMARLEEESTGEHPFHNLANFTLSDVLQLKERADWMASAGITLAEYEYLAYNVQSQAIALPYTEAMLVDTATTLLNQSADLLLTPLSLAADAATISDAAAAAIYEVLKARNLVEEIELALPTPTGDFRSVKRGVVMPAVLSLQAGDPELTELQQAIVLAVAAAMNWATSFNGSELGVSKQTLLDQQIIAPHPQKPGETTGLVLQPISVDPDRPIAEQTLLRDLLVNRLELQRAIPQEVLTRLQDQRRAFDATLLTDFASLLDTDAERLLNTMQNTSGQLYHQGVWDAPQLMLGLNQIVKAPKSVTASSVDQDLRQLHKILLLLAQFNLSEAETQLLLTQSQAIFGINPAHLFTPTFRDLQRLYTFTHLKQALGDRNDGLIQVLQQQTPLHEFTGWVESDIPKVAEKLHIPAGTYHALPAIARLHQAFTLIQQLQTEPADLFELADFRDRTFATYQDHAATVLGLMRAQYTEEQWPKVYKPLHDRLAVKKRDALTAVILEKLSDQLGDRKTPNILYEYLLIDVQTGSAVETSRIVQGIASLQLYVQRCLMNLEYGINPEKIPLDEWKWMKNYRVWEVNRKVFLYPENYIEPELRNTKTPLFKDLEDGLQQGNVTTETVKQAYTTYLNNFAEVANLTIIGSYYNTNRSPQTGSALTFSGQDFIAVSSLAEAKALIPQNFTIELWVKPTLPPSGWGGIASAYNLADDKTNSGGWILEVGQSRFKFHLKTASTDNDFVSLQVSFTPNQWYHLAVTYDGTHARLYLNAEEKAAIACSGAIAYPPNLTNAHQFVLGARKDVNYQANFAGQLREIRLWNTARSAEQLKAGMYQEIKDRQQELSEIDRPALLRCWNYDALRAIATDTTVTDFSAAQQALSFTLPAVRWQSTPLVETVHQDEVGDEKTTLYLVGRNEVTQECYIRELINQRRWTPWRKLGITINAQFVSPVFAFNRLFLFWADIQDSIRSERRKWVGNNTEGKPIDQIGEEIKLVAKQELTLSSGEKSESATTDILDGGKLNANTFEFSDKNGFERHVNIPVKKPILKFSYANFSQDWIHPLVVNHASTNLEQKELSTWEQLQPDWLRIYAQRWRGSDVTPLVQRPSQKLSNVRVTQLGPNSHLSLQVPDFSPLPLSNEADAPEKEAFGTFSFWLRVNPLQGETSTAKETPDDPDPITLFSYAVSSSSRIQVKITYTPTPIGEQPQFMEAVDQSLAAVGIVRNSLRAIINFLADNTAAVLAGTAAEDKAAKYGQVSLQKELIRSHQATVKASYEAINQKDAPQRQLAVAVFNWLSDIAKVHEQVDTVHLATNDPTQEIATLAKRVADQANGIAKVVDQAKLIVPTVDTTVVTGAAQKIKAKVDALGTDKSLVEVTTATREALAESIAGLNDTDGLGKVLGQVVDKVAKWNPFTPQLSVQLGQSLWKVEGATKPDLTLCHWLYVVFVPSRSADKVRSDVVIYDSDAKTTTQLIYTPVTSVADWLQPGQELTIGLATNPPATADQKGQFQVHISEFRLWDTDRSEVEIKEAERFERKHGKERGLQVYLPLDSDRFDDQPLTLASSDLRLTKTFAPEQPIVEGDRERILLLYGDYAFSLRNTLKDPGFSYELLKNDAAQNNYDLSLGLQSQGISAIAGDGQGTSAIAGDGQETGEIGVVGQETDARIRVEQYRSDQILPLDRFLPAARSKVLKNELASAKPKVMTEAEQEWQDNAQNDTLLVNKGDVQLDIAASYIMDVHNQPGSWILDIGDQVFWVKINLDQLRLLTAEERLRANPAQEQPTRGAGQAFDLYYDRDRALEVRDGVIPKFEFTRLNTSAVQTLSEKLLGEEGISDLLGIDSQNLSEPDFSKLAKLEENRIVAPRYRSDGSLDNRIDFSGAYGIYYQEIFFHIPLLIANKLSADQRFAEAQEWYHYIFNPTAQEPPDSPAANTKDRYWRYRDFRNLSLETITELLSDETALEAYREDPFDSHAIAALRINTYQKTVVMKYIKNLLDWGDSLFRQDTREAINEATQLYVLAYTLMGDRPTSKPAPTPETVGSYRDIEATLDHTAANPLPDFLIPTPGANGGQPVVKAIPFDPNRTVTNRFGVPANDSFIGLWDQIDDRLFKIRHSLNIDGVFRSLSLFEPPIDPAALVRAAAGGNLASAISAATAGNAAFTPHYRYSVMLEQAKAYTDLVTDFGGALLDALTNRDDAALAQLERTHEQALLQQTTDLKQWAIDEAKLNQEELELSRREAEHRYNFFDTEMNKTKPFGASGLEVTGLTFRGVQIVIENIAAVLNAIAASVSTVAVSVTMGGSGAGGSPVATAETSGPKWAKSVENWGRATEIVGGAFGDLADFLEKLAEYENRYKEWKRDRESANYDKLQIEKQIEQADIQIKAAERELANHQLEIEQHQEIAAFHQRKFANGELYNWMANRLSTLYFQAYNLAYDLAKQAERAYQFEFASNDTFINFGYWDNRRRGLLAGEALKLDLARLEKTALDNDSRYMEITKTISLSRINPVAFLELRKTGRCQFSLDEMLFARDFPGHYFRVIKALSISIPAVVGPYQSVHAMLTQTGHKTLLEPDMDGVEFMMGLSSDRPASVRVNWRANQQIAISTAIEDGGVFELDFNDDRYLPFENTGVVSNWLLEVPRDTNFFDYDTITDVILHLRYMSVPDSGSFRAAVRDLDEFKTYRSARLFNVSQEFPAQWHAFTQTEVDTLELPIPPHTFPSNLELAPFGDEAISAIYGITLQGEIKMDLKDKFSSSIVPSETQPGTYSIVLTDEGVKDKSQLAVMMVILKYEGKLKTYT